jgi:cystathionine beta-lyase/cystathionine gamma-synthase
VRVRTQTEHAGKVADGLLAHPAVERVHYPGLAECDPAGLVGRQMEAPGAVLALEVAGGYAAACRVAAGVRLVTHAVSLGGVDTLLQHPAALTHRPVAAEAKPHAGLLRLSVGLEDPADVLADLYRALDAARD